MASTWSLSPTVSHPLFSNSESYLLLAAASSSFSFSYSINGRSSLSCSTGTATYPKVAIRKAYASRPAVRLSSGSHICRAAEYRFPDPIPEFADAETEKFRNHLMTKLSKKDIFGDSINDVVGICTEIFNTFLHSEYGGPGTLLVIPFIDMADTINERGLPGGPQAARVAVKWAQEHVDKDWNQWNGEDSS